MAATGCHPALQNPDVVWRILQQLSLSLLDDRCSYDGTRKMHIGLYACARVCRMFLEPALDFLWWKLRDITPAFRLLPSIRVDVDAGKRTRFSTSPSVKCYMTGMPSDQEWTHFQEYARRVRVIDKCCAYFGLPAILSQLSDRNDGRPLFPILQQTSWYYSLTEDNSSIATLIPPTLRHLSINLEPEYIECYIYGMAERASHACRIILQAVPDLRILQLYASCNGLMLPVKLCRNLQKFDASRSKLTLDPKFWRDLSRLRLLSEVKGGFRVPHNIPNHGFVALQSLSLDYVKAKYANRLLKVVPPQQLRYITFILVQSTPDQLLETMTLISSRSSTSLQTFDVVIHSDSDLAVHISVMSMIEPLLSIRGLQKMFLRMSGPDATFAISDKDVERLAISWPELRKLNLDLLCIKTRPTLQSLMTLASYCPHLQTLQLPIFSIGVDDIPMEATLSHSLQQLDVDRLFRVSGEHAPVARFIDTLFPHLHIRKMLKKRWRARKDWWKILFLLQRYQIDRNGGDHAAAVPEDEDELDFPERDSGSDEC